MEPDLINEFVPGDAQLILPGDAQSQGIAPAYNAMVNENLLQPQGNIPVRELVTKAGRNLATNYAMKKLGIDGIAGNVLQSVIGGGLASINPIAMFTMGSVLPNPVRGIAGFLRKKRADKEYQRSENILEAKILSDILSRQAANTAAAAGQGGGRDVNMGGGSIPTKTSAPKSSGATSNPYSGGPGGVQSGL